MTERSLYAEYVEEREGKRIIENDKGFATYYIVSNTMYVGDVFVRKDFRRSGIATMFIDTLCSIAQQEKCIDLVASVDTTTSGWELSKGALENYGFTVEMNFGNQIYLSKRLM